MSYHDLKKTAREINFKYPKAKRKRIVDAKKRVRDAARWAGVVKNKDKPNSKAKKEYEAYLKRAAKYREAHREEINARQRAKRKKAPKKPLTQKQKIQNRLKQRRYRQKHKKKIQARQRAAYRRKHPNGPGRGKWLRKKPLKAA